MTERAREAKRILGAPRLEPAEWEEGLETRRESDPTGKVVALIGALLIGVGVFLPLVRLPLLGAIDLFEGGSSEAWILLMLAAAAGGLALADLTRHALWPGLAALGLIALAFIRTQTRIAELQRRAETELDGNPLEAFAQAAVGAVQLEYGWAVLVVGALMAVGGGAMAWRRR